MSDIVYNRLKEVCPQKSLSEMDILEVQKACRVAFEIIGYSPENFDESFMKTWESSERDDLYEFIYDVWEVDR